jgi:glycerol-3-phosphate O-acyltransferase/dihydroxyacetone phosphate acyltransferase
MAVGRPLVDLALDGVAWLVSHGLFRTVDVTGRSRIPDDRPIVIVANHFNGLVDAVLLAAVCRGVPRFVAKATLWRSPLVRPLLALAGLVPVSRPEDHPGGPVDNATLFGRAYDLLRRHGMLAIFPEGTTHDRLELQRVRTGAARIALGAHDDGVEGVTLVPIGLTFDDKLALRSRVLARVGDPIDVDRWLQKRGDADEAHDVDDHPTVQALTEQIRRGLSETTPRYDDVLERAMLNRAADVRLRTDLTSPDQIVSLASRESLAQAIADAPAPARREVMDALGTYQVQLDLLRLRDDLLVPRVDARYVLRRALGLTVYLVVLGVVVAAGVAVNVVPTFLTAVAGRRPAVPVTKGTVRVLAALIVFPLAWLVVAIAAPVTGFWPTLAVFLACPAAGAVAVGGLERVIALARAWAGWMGLRNTRGVLDRVLATRRRVCEQVDLAAAQRL